MSVSLDTHKSQQHNLVRGRLSPAAAADLVASLFHGRRNARKGVGTLTYS
jgi:hypothetical protein